jgi:hypothetical protein
MVEAMSRTLNGVDENHRCPKRRLMDIIIIIIIFREFPGEGIAQSV